MPVGGRLALTGLAVGEAPDLDLQLREFGAQALDFTLQRVGAAVARHAVGVETGGVGLLPALDRAGGNADDGCIGGDGIDHDGIGADAGVIADGDGSQNLGAGADDDVVSHGRVAFTPHCARDAEGDLVINITIVADFGGFADDDPHAVIDDESAPDFGGWMNFDTSQPACDV